MNTRTITIERLRLFIEIYRTKVNDMQRIKALSTAFGSFNSEEYRAGEAVVLNILEDLLPLLADTSSDVGDALEHYCDNDLSN
jgi:hypothetical protein